MRACADARVFFLNAAHPSSEDFAIISVAWTVNPGLC
jgi:hypothetical protein